MTRKSTVRTLHYRATGWREPVSLATFRQQMADYARGEELRKLRADKPTENGKRLSQEVAALEIGVTAKTLRSWESNGPIKRENAQKVAAYYNVPIGQVAASEPDELGGAHDELRRIERKIDAILAHFSIEAPDLSEIVSDFERETDDPAEPQAEPKPQRRGRRAA